MNTNQCQTTFSSPTNNSLSTFFQRFLSEQGIKKPTFRLSRLNREQIFRGPNFIRGPRLDQTIINHINFVGLNGPPALTVFRGN